MVSLTELGYVMWRGLTVFLLIVRAKPVLTFGLENTPPKRIGHTWLYCNKGGVEGPAGTANAVQLF